METTLYAKVDSETLEQAKMLLNKLGIPMSHAIDMFLRQVVIEGDISFVMKEPEKDRSEGTDDMEKRIYSADEAKELLHKLYGI